MTTLSIAHTHARTDLDWPYRGDARAWELLAEVLDGKLDVQTLCERQRMRLDEVQGWLRERHRSALMAFDDQLKRALIRQGAPPEALVGPELSMSLADVSMLDWIQAIQIFAKQAVITVLHDEGESRIWCSQGSVVDAISGRLSGEAAVYRLVALERGQVLTELRSVHRERTIRSSTAWLLLEAVRRKDESSQLKLALGDLERVFQCSQGALNRSLNTAEAATLRLFDESRRLADVLARSEIGDIETLAALESLIRLGQLIEASPVSGERPKAKGRRAESAERAPVLPIAFAWPQLPYQERTAPPSGNWRWMASTLVMGVLVSSAAWLGTQVSAKPTVAPSAAPEVRPEPAAMTYPVTVRTYPLDAELEVDGHIVGQGYWTARLARDAVVHELRVSATGFVPVRIVFIDTAPPTHVRLDPLPATPISERGPIELASAGSDERANTVASASVPRTTAPRKRRLKPPNSLVPLADAARPGKGKPYVQIIDGDEARGQPN